MKKTILHGLSSKWKEILISIITIIIIYFLSIYFAHSIIGYLRQFHFFEQIFQYVSQEISRKSSIGLSLMTFLANLFFITYPSEVLFFFYAKVGYSVFYISAIMIFWMMVAQAINYGCGLLIEKKIIAKFIKDNKKEFSVSMRRYDVLFIVIISLLPLPGDLLSLFLGMIRYDFKKMMLYTFIGKVLKYLFLSILVLFFHGIWYFF
ncbi:MAG: VTT domain-containing protein [archaeon]